MKQSGIADQCYVSGYDLSGDVGQLKGIAGGKSPLVVTGISSSALERIGGKRDGQINFQTFFNDATDQAHPVLSALPTADRIVSYARGLGSGSPIASTVAKQINYDQTLAADGGLTFAVTAQANSFGLEWGDQLTSGLAAHSGAASETGLDSGGASTTFGLQAYLHVVSFTGTDATITIQESSDDASGDPYANITGGAFAQVTGAPFSQRIATSATQTIERWLRVTTTTSGGFTQMSFIVQVSRNLTATSF